MYGPKWPFSLRYGSRDTRRIDFLLVDGLLTDTPGLGRHIMLLPYTLLLAVINIIDVFYKILK